MGGYRKIPLNAFERSQLVSICLMPKFIYKGLLVFNDFHLVELDNKTREYILSAKGLNPTVNKVRLVTPRKEGGMGLHQAYWTWRCRFVTVIQRMLREETQIHGSVLQTYDNILSQVNAHRGDAEERRPQRGGPNLIDSESSGDEAPSNDDYKLREWVEKYYISEPNGRHIQAGGVVPEGFEKCHLGNHEIYIKGHIPPAVHQGHSDGSMKEDRAGVGIVLETAEIIGRVVGPQCSYRAELMGAAVFSHIASDGANLALDNMSVANYCTEYPSKESADMDLRKEIHDNLQQVDFDCRWIPGHRKERDAANDQDLQDIRLNNRADELAKMGSLLPLPEQVRAKREHIVVTRGIAPTPAKKWIINNRKTITDSTIHWTTWLPLGGTRRGWWLVWLWGLVHWVGCSYPQGRSLVDRCTLCQNTHRTTTQTRLRDCDVWRPAFKDAWVTAWGDISHLMLQWWNQASEDELDQASMLRITTGMVDFMPQRVRQRMRKYVALFQYHVTFNVQKLRGVLPMIQALHPDRAKFKTEWYGPLQIKEIRPNPTKWRLRQQVRFTGNGFEPRSRQQKPKAKPVAEKTFLAATERRKYGWWKSTWSLNRKVPEWMQKWANNVINLVKLPLRKDADCLAALPMLHITEDEAAQRNGVLASQKFMFETLIRFRNHLTTAMVMQDSYLMAADALHTVHSRVRSQMFHSLVLYAEEVRSYIRRNRKDLAAMKHTKSLWYQKLVEGTGKQWIREKYAQWLPRAQQLYLKGKVDRENEWGTAEQAQQTLFTLQEQEKRKEAAEKAWVTRNKHQLTPVKKQEPNQTSCSPSVSSSAGESLPVNSPEAVRAWKKRRELEQSLSQKSDSGSTNSQKAREAWERRIASQSSASNFR